jgi:hypothetical protein
LYWEWAASSHSAARSSYSLSSGSGSGGNVEPEPREPWRADRDEQRLDRLDTALEIIEAGCDQVGSREIRGRALGHSHPLTIALHSIVAARCIRDDLVRLPKGRAQ